MARNPAPGSVLDIMRTRGVSRRQAQKLAGKPLSKRTTAERKTPTSSYGRFVRALSDETGTPPGQLRQSSDTKELWKTVRDRKMDPKTRRDRMKEIADRLGVEDINQVFKKYTSTKDSVPNAA